jgi:ATP-dependent Clp protease adapter protein ClpS
MSVSLPQRSPWRLAVLSCFIVILITNNLTVVTSFSASNKMTEFQQQPYRHRHQQHKGIDSRSMATQLYGSATVEAPTRPDTDVDRKTGPNKRDSNKKSRDDDDDDDSTNDLEYYIDPSASREDNEPFHILLMGSITYAKPKVTVPYVSTTLQYVLSMPPTDATELSQFAHDNDMSCLGTWTREQCLVYGKQLQRRDVICRVVPYCTGGQRGWQAKDASSLSSSSNSNNSGQ